MHLDLVQRVVARFAARVFNIPPWKMLSCQDCGGDGVHVEKAYRVKYLCTRCWGTGTDPGPLKGLQKDIDRLTDVIKDKQRAFDEAKKKAMGRGGRHLGMMGREIQTINGELRARQEELLREEERIDEGKKLAKFAGALAR